MTTKIKKTIALALVCGYFIFLLLSAIPIMMVGTGHFDISECIKTTILALWLLLIIGPLIVCLFRKGGGPVVW